MNEQEIQDRLTVIDSKLAAIQVKSLAIGLGGGIAGVAILGKDKKLLSKVGFFFLGNIIVGIGSNLLFSSNAAELLAEKENLQRQLN